MSVPRAVRARLRRALAAAALGALCGVHSAAQAADPLVTVTSLNPDSGVAITPCCGMNACAMFVEETPFTYRCPAGSPVRLEAPALVGETSFTEWRRPGQLPYTVSPTFIFQPDTDVTLTVVYGNPVESLPDFAVTAISLTPASPVSGLPFSAAVTVTNQGAAAQQLDAWLEIWSDRADEPACRSTGVAAKGFGSLAPGAGRVLTFANLTAGPVGTATFRAFADAYCIVREADDADNQTTLAYTVRPRKILSVSSENPANAAVTVAPADLVGQANGTSPFGRSYDPGASVTLTAPAEVGGYVFKRWRQDGLELATTPAVTVTMDADHHLVAVYARPPSPDFWVGNITLMPAEPTAGYAFSASVTVGNKGDADGFGGKLAVWTNKVFNAACTWADASQWLQVGALAAGESRTFVFSGLGPLAQGSSYHFRASVDASCDTPEGVNGDRDGDNQSTRDYLVLPGTAHLLQVGTLDGRAVEIAHTMDVSGRTSGTTAFTRRFRDRATVTLTAPAATADGGVFQKWVGLAPAVPTTPEVSFTMDGGTSVRAVYVGPGEPDFAVTALSIDPPAPPAGGTFSATVTITNVGTGRGVPGCLDLFPDRGTPAGCWAGSIYGPMYLYDLAAGASLTFTIPGIPAGARGAKSLLAFVDSFCETDEPDEADNQVFVGYEAVNVPPVLDAIGDRTVGEGELLSFTVAATDANGDALTFGAGGLPEGAGFDPATRTFSWRPGFGQTGRYQGLRFTASDAEASDERIISIVVTPTNRAPWIEPIPDQAAVEGAPLVVAVTSGDPDGDSPLAVGAANLPAGAVFDPAARVLRWTPGFGQAGRHEGIVITARDPQGAAATETIAVDVAEPAGPVFSDDFTSAAPPLAAEGDPWLPLAGAWTRANGVYASRSDRRSGLSRIALLDPGALPLGAGIVQARFKLTTAAAGSLGPNALIVFGLGDPGRFRWVRFTRGAVQIGQTGVIDGIAGGKKKGAATIIRTGRWYRFTVRIERDGWVRVFRGGATTPLVSHRFAVSATLPSVVPGGVGLATTRARAVFDDVVVWEESALLAPPAGAAP